MRFLVSIWLCCALQATAQTIKPKIVSIPADGSVAVVEVRAHFVTAIRMPAAVNSAAGSLRNNPLVFCQPESPNPNLMQKPHRQPFEPARRRGVGFAT
jgi:hypothetical protein